ncbi:hypothetical protein [Lichenifustis flavocetrariae]|uniref:Uncharacterized protein n=1 Tax=Lichenifustis flavocetrariae TaxID=2949735 RepID=A0AA41Z3L8_9HYPH|nr:hypothetical protein [Lichenifustis flavocetrariae]MCW6512298.1 hypothetical protein [Lichenifustis flavocetrariae]
MSTANTINLGTATIAIPASCPQPDIFKAVFMARLIERFGTAETAADALAQWQHIQPVPQPFSVNAEATRLYREAGYALNPKAKAWDDFQEEVFCAFLDFEEDGSDRTPPIPGWSMDPSDLPG